MRWGGHVACMGATVDAYKVMDWKLELFTWKP